MTAPSRQHLVPLGDICAGLSARIEELAAQLLPAGVREGSEWCVGSLAGEAGRSLKVHLREPRAGVWKDFAAGSAGDALDLVAQVQFRGDKAQAIAWAKAWLGYSSADPASFAVARRIAEKKRTDSQVQAAADDARRASKAKGLWLAGRDSIKGTLAELYLNGRGIDFGAIGRYPRSLRFLAAHDAWQPKRGSQTYEKVGTFPCLVAAIVDRDGNHVATHRTWLQSRVDGDGVVSVGKAPLADPKLSLGRFAGGCIRLFKPLLTDNADGQARRAPSLGQAPEGSGVYVTEGIEDGCSVAMADQSQYILVAVSLGNMAQLWLPDQVRRVTFVAQNDTAKEAIAGLDRAIEAQLKAGRDVFVAKPEPGVKDVNDLLQTKVSQ
jgi:hypothetical protein